MKKAYVKPVFFAEEFVAETSYANSACGTKIWELLEIVDGHSYCETHADCGSNTLKVGSNKGTINTDYTGTWHVTPPDGDKTFWAYANVGDKAYMFSSTMMECDFVWSGNKSDQIHIWNSTDKSVRNDTNNLIGSMVNGSWIAQGFGVVSQFFAGNSSSGGNHDVGYEGTAFRS